MIGLIPLLGGSLLWILGMWMTGRGDRAAPWRRLEYWWCYGIFAFGGLASITGFALPELNGNVVLALRLAPMVVIGALMVLSRRDWFFPPSGLWLLGLSLLFVAIGIGVHQYQMAVFSLLLLLPTTVVPESGWSLSALKAGARHATIVFLLLICAAAALRPGTTLGDCRLDKCSVWGVALGAEGTGNAAGLVLAATGVITLLESRRLVPSLAIAIGSVTLVDLTSSRSAMNTWLIGVALVLLFHLSRRVRRRWPLTLGLVAVSGAVAAIPFGPWQPSDFTGRVILWLQARDLFAHNPLFGYGTSYWVGQEASAELDANYATHNLLTEMLVSGGIFGLTLFICAIVAAVIRRGAPTYAIAVIGLTIGGCLTEVLSAPGRVYVLPGLFAFALVAANASPMGASAQQQVDEDDDAQDRARVVTRERLTAIPSPRRG